MSKNDKDLQDIVGDAMGADMFGAPKKKAPKTVRYPYSTGGPAGSPRRPLWQDDKYLDEFDDVLNDPTPFSLTPAKPSSNLPKIDERSGVVFLEQHHLLKLKKSLEYAVGDALDENNLVFAHRDMMKVLDALNVVVDTHIEDAKYSAHGASYEIDVKGSLVDGEEDFYGR